ncbi:MAG: hypothetical protein HC800_13490 [Phormidesmis sp. RL_2_1]|nr:hypothetical protein [Phormidesmis sp. RL_2_1]
MNSISELITTVLEVQSHRGQKMAERLCLKNSETTTISDPSAALRQLSKEALRAAGLTEKQACKLMAAITLGRLAYTPKSDAQAEITTVDDPSVAVALLILTLGWKCREHAAVLIMDVHHKWLATEVISVGSRTACPLHPDAVFTAALRHGGKRIIIAHNHPSGNLAASPEDISLTRIMVKAGFLMDIPVLDHFIIGNGDYKSIREETTI